MTERSRRCRRLGATVAALGMAVVIGSCSPSSGDASDAPADAGSATTLAVEDEVTPADRLCTAVGGTEGVVERDGLDETSGVVASRSRPGVLWAHDDSGGDAEVFAVGLDGSDRGQVGLAGIESIDWEDIALLPGSDGGPDQLVVADIGDNLGTTRGDRPLLLQRVDEPVAPGEGEEATAAVVTTIRIAYPDGPRDAEALLADPVTGDVFVVSKQWDGAEAGLYRVPADAVSAAAPTGTVTMERSGSVAATTATLVTGGDVSADGRIVVLRTYTSVMVWDRAPGTAVAEALADPPTCTLEVDEPQGEAVAVLPDGSGFVTISEGEGPDVLVFRAP